MWKWNTEYFCRIGLVPAAWHYYKDMYPEYTIEKYIELRTKANKEKRQKHIEKLRERGRKYYIQERFRKIASTGYVFAK